MTSNPITKYIGGTALAGLTILSAIYNDRAVFDSTREDVKTQAGWPLVGNLPMLIQNKDKIHDFLLEAFTRLDELTV